VSDIGEVRYDTTKASSVTRGMALDDNVGYHEGCAQYVNQGGRVRNGPAFFVHIPNCNLCFTEKTPMLCWQVYFPFIKDERDVHAERTLQDPWGGRALGGQEARSRSLHKGILCSPLLKEEKEGRP
jgi:hypothetical protein